ncbi:MAG: AzlD domain-containing protein [Oscillospiraceae bacterium]
MTYIALSIASMAIITYIIRFLPFGIFKKQINSRFIQSFLYYVPYSVLTAMTFPAIFYSTNNVWSGLIATAVAIFLALRNKSLVVIAIAAVATAYIVLLFI